MRSSLLAAAALLCGVSAAAQTTSYKDSITVIGDAEQVTAGQSSRSAETLDMQAHPALVWEPSAYLRNDASVDIQMRGPMGVQSDVAIRGGTFEQTLVLLNGLRINDAETSHFNLDIPVPLPALQGMGVLHGAGSTLYGSDALAGVIDVHTLQPEASSLRLRAGVGSYGINEQSFLASGVRGKLSEVLSGQRDFSTGFIADRDYRSESTASETRFHSALGDSDVLVAGSDRGFGADQFYGNYPSFERTKGWFGAFTQAFDAKTALAFAYRRHTDQFVLFRTNPTIYENNHIDTSWQAILRRKDTVGQHVSLFYGLDSNADQINSNSLGKHGRNRTAGYFDGDLRWKRATLSAGLREEVIDGYGVVSSPGVSASLMLNEKLKARSSVGYGFRLPTYTDKYYNDPTTVANPTLEPESGWSYDGGLDWYPAAKLALSATGLASRQSNAIDYVRSNSMAKYQAQNLTSVNLYGAEVSLHAQLPHAQQLHVAYTALTGAAGALGGLQSRYLFNYPTHNGGAEWIAPINQVAVRAHVGAAQRVQQTAYATFDLSAARETGMFRPYVRMTNLTNTGYQEISGIRMQGRAFVGGVELVLTQAKH